MSKLTEYTVADAIVGVDIVNDFVANLGAIRAYDAVIFGLVEADPQAVIDDIERLCRKNVFRLFTEARKQNRYQRDVAHEIFKPEKSDLMEYNALSQIR